MASSTLVGSSLNAGSVSVKAGNDVVVTGSALTAQDALTVVAGRDLVVTSGQQTVDESHSAESKKSGFSLTTYGVGYATSAEQRNSRTARRRAPRNWAARSAAEPSPPSPGAT